MKDYLIYNWQCLKYGIKSPYKWLLIFYILWLYRVEFVPADDGGLAKFVQVATLIGMIMLVVSYNRNIIRETFKTRNSSFHSLLILYSYATITGLFSTMPQFAIFLSLQNIVLIIVLFWLFSFCDDFVSTERLFLVFSTSQLIAENIVYRFLNEHSLMVHFLGGGSMAALLISYCVGELLSMRYEDVERKEMLRNVILLCVFILVISTSSGANASAVFGISVALFFSGKIFYAICLLLLLFFLYLFQDWIVVIIQFIMPGKDMNDIETATGRERQWEIMMELANKKPWFGWGFGCIERVASDTGRIGFSIPDAHSNYVGFYGSLGYIGSAIAYYHFASSWIFSLKNRLRTGYVGILSAISCAIMNGYSYGFLASKACSITVIYFAIIVVMYYYSTIEIYDSTRIEQ